MAAAFFKDSQAAADKILIFQRHELSFPFPRFLLSGARAGKERAKGRNQSWFLGHPPQKKRKEEKRMTYQDCIPRPLTSSRIPDKIECWELVFSSTALVSILSMDGRGRNLHSQSFFFLALFSCVFFPLPRARATKERKERKRPEGQNLFPFVSSFLSANAKTLSLSRARRGKEDT